MIPKMLSFLQTHHQRELIRLKLVMDRHRHTETLYRVEEKDIRPNCVAAQYYDKWLLEYFNLNTFVRKSLIAMNQLFVM